MRESKCVCNFFEKNRATEWMYHQYESASTCAYTHVISLYVISPGMSGKLRVGRKGGGGRHIKHFLEGIGYFHRPVQQTNKRHRARIHAHT